MTAAKPPPSRFTALAPYAAALGVALLWLAWPLGQRYAGLDAKLSLPLFLVMCLGLFFLLLELCHPRFALPTRLRLSLAALLFALTLGTARPSEGRYLMHFLGLAGLALLALGLWHWQRPVRLLSRLRPPRLEPHGAAVAAAWAMLAIGVFLSWFCFGFLPAIVDSTAQYVQGKIMAAGELYGTPHPHPDFFPVWMMLREEKVFAQYQPLHVMLLALGHVARAPWLVNPLCAAVTTFAAAMLAARIFGAGAARLTALFMLASQFMLFMSAEYMNHASALLFITLFMLAYAQALDACRKPNVRAARKLGLAAGLFLGAVALIRPFTALGMGAPFLLHAAWLCWKAPRRYLGAALFAAGGMGFCLGFMLWYNDATSGHMLTFPSTTYHRGHLSEALGFYGAFSPAFALSKAQTEWWQVNRYLFEWPVPCLLLLALYLLRPKRSALAWLLVASIASHTLVNMANQFQSIIFGPRYLYETLAPVIILSAAGLARLPILLSALRTSYTRRELGIYVRLLCAMLFAVSLLMRLPQNILYYANRYMDNDPAFYHSMLAQAERPALIFMGRMPKEKLKDYYIATMPYRKVAFTFPPSPQDSVIFARDLPGKNGALMRFYPGRHYYFEENGKLKEIK